jgi:hypothetical chaperone protein
MTSSANTTCGFDFGTSNSSIGRIVDGIPRLVEIQQGQVSIPTAVFFSSDDGNTYYGRESVERYLDREEGRLMRALKGVLGTSLIQEATQVSRQSLRFLDIISLFIAFVREEADGPTSVVMGRPVHFVDSDEAADRNAEDELRKATEQAGFDIIEFQYEPIAAALDYERLVEHEQLAFVVDIGGGTSDFSIVRVSPSRRNKADRKTDILGYAGVRVGGTDFDRYLNLQTVMPHLGMETQMRHNGMRPPVWWFHDLATWQRINYMYDPRLITDIKQVRRDAVEPEKIDRLIQVIEARNGHKLLGAVEQAKIDLSDTESTTLPLLNLVDVSDPVLTRYNLEDAIGASIDRVTACMRNTLVDAGVSREMINAVFLTGGSSRLPLLRAEVQNVFPGAALIDGDAFCSVATGLTMDARNKFGS